MSLNIHGNEYHQNSYRRSSGGFSRRADCHNRTSSSLSRSLQTLARTKEFVVVLLTVAIVVLAVVSAGVVVGGVAVVCTKSYFNY